MSNLDSRQMSKKRTADPYKRNKTRYPGITFRTKKDGSRVYSVLHRKKWHPVEGGERDALELQATLRNEPKKPPIPRTTRFAAYAESSYANKVYRRPRTAEYHRAALDLVLLPRFGDLKVGSIDANAITKLIRDLEREGLHATDPTRKARPLGRSSIENYLKPLRWIMKLAVRQGLIPSNPFDVLTPEDRPIREEREPAHEWTDSKIAALLGASAALAAEPTARQDYTLLLRTTATLGPRCGEILGLKWSDFNKDTGHIHIQRQWLRPTKFKGERLPARYGPTKTPAGVRSIPLPTSLRDELIAFRLLSQFSRDDDPIFASQAGTPLQHRNVTARGFDRARDKAGLDPSLTFHDLRDAAASRLIDAGLDPVTVAGVLGHDDPSVTLKTYAHRFNRQQRDEQIRLALG